MGSENSVNNYISISDSSDTDVVHKEKHKGLFHLRQSATLNNTNGMYLYDLLMLALGHYPKGKKVFG